ncbi:MAG: LamG-like jellyroll fold domain-containing protein, partial [Verrucomicrobiota bacterium]
DFRFSDLSGYRKIVDFKNLSSDNGLYNLSTSLDFYNVTTGPAGAFTANETVRLVITRDDASDLFTSYVDGVQQLSFTDTGELGLFSGANSIIHFVIDDLAIGGEASAGVVDRIAIYDSALSTADVAALGGPTASVPEPGNILAALGIIGVSLAGRRRR